MYKVIIRRKPNQFINKFMREVRDGETKESLANYLFAKNGDVVFTIERARFNEVKDYVHRKCEIGDCDE